MKCRTASTANSPRTSQVSMIDKIAWIRVEDGRILSSRSRGKDVYYIPGGKPEPGEEDIETLVREVEEELSVDQIVFDHRHEAGRLR